jgi:hypothetical protein
MSIGEEFVYTVMGKIAEIFESLDKFYYDNKYQFNNLLKTQIHFLSKKYTYRGLKNYSVENNGRFIDVIWTSENYNIVAAFLISDDYTDTVIGDLARLDSFYKFLIYYGEAEIPYAKKLVNQYNVHIIRTYRKIEK